MIRLKSSKYNLIKNHQTSFTFYHHTHFDKYLNFPEDFFVAILYFDNFVIMAVLSIINVTSAFLWDSYKNHGERKFRYFYVNHYLYVKLSFLLLCKKIIFYLYRVMWVFLLILSRIKISFYFFFFTFLFFLVMCCV